MTRQILHAGPVAIGGGAPGSILIHAQYTHDRRRRVAPRQIRQLGRRRL